MYGNTSVCMGRNDHDDLKHYKVKKELSKTECRIPWYCGTEFTGAGSMYIE